MTDLEAVALLNEALGSRIVAFKAILAHLAGGALPGLFLSQAWYHSKERTDEEGWFAWRREDCENEIVLSRWEQEHARKVLKTKGFIEETLKGIPAILHFRLDKLAILRAIQEARPGGKPPNPWAVKPPTRSPQPVGGKTSNQLAVKPPTVMLENLQLCGGKTSNPWAVKPPTIIIENPEEDHRRSEITKDLIPVGEKEPFLDAEPSYTSKEESLREFCSLAAVPSLDLADDSSMEKGLRRVLDARGIHYKPKQLKATCREVREATGLTDRAELNRYLASNVMGLVGAKRDIRDWSYLAVCLQSDESLKRWRRRRREGVPAAARGSETQRTEAPRAAESAPEGRSNDPISPSPRPPVSAEGSHAPAIMERVTRPKDPYAGMRPAEIEAKKAYDAVKLEMEQEDAERKAAGLPPITLWDIIEEKKAESRRLLARGQELAKFYRHLDR